MERYKRDFPCFVKTDISRFYPSIRHRDLVVYCQVAWRELLGLDYVPAGFKKTYVGPLVKWCNSLPLTQGIPLGSPLSAVLAPVMLVPLWIELKREFRLPFLVYMDDVLVFCATPEETARVYAFLDQRLATLYGLCLNPQKTASGRFAVDGVDFCGWHFSGGYARIGDAKVGRFKENLTRLIGRSHDCDLCPLLKRVNRTVDGFGNYYKHGHVNKQFDQLDAFVRLHVRSWLRNHAYSRKTDNQSLSELGLHNLKAIRTRLMLPGARKNQGLRPLNGPEKRLRPAATEIAGSPHALLLAEWMEKTDTKLQQLITIQRKQLNVLRSIINTKN